MNLIELYNRLTIPIGKEKVFNALIIPDYSNFRIAIDNQGFPVILISILNPSNNSVLKNFRLKYLQLEQNIECKISENGKSSFKVFTLLTFTSIDRNLQEYFLKISETLVKSLSKDLTQQEAIESIYKFVEIFRTLTDTPTNTLHGLWTELFLIDNSNNPSVLLNYWHCSPEEKFDFNSGEEKIEVKSNSSFERKHIFSSEQLNPSINTQVLIASIFIRQNTNGQSIQQLVDNITTKIQDEIDLIIKLNQIVCKTLGNSFEQSIKINFDYNIAKDSLQFYQHQDIPKIDEINIPNLVSEVKFKSDLSKLTPINLAKVEYKGALFISI